MELCLLGSAVSPDKWWELQARDGMVIQLRSSGGDGG